MERDYNFYFMGRAIGWVISDHAEAAAAWLDDNDGITENQRESFLAGHRDTRIECEAGLAEKWAKEINEECAHGKSSRFSNRG